MLFKTKGTNKNAICIIEQFCRHVLPHFNAFLLSRGIRFLLNFITFKKVKYINFSTSVQDPSFAPEHTEALNIMIPIMPSNIRENSHVSLMNILK